jgi:hypothetical protein
MAADVVAQKRARNTAVTVDKTKPTIYIEAVPVELLRAVRAPEGELWLRVRNNSRWGIRLEMSGGHHKKLDDARLYYDIIDRDENIVSRRMCHVCSSNILGPGKGVIFSVPKDTMSKDLSLRLLFSYEWENRLKVASGLEPLHYVLISWDDLPSNIGDTTRKQQN